MNVALLALKNLQRYRSRTLGKAAAIGLITAIMLVWGAVNSGLSDLLVRQATEFDTGEFQLHGRGFVESPDLYTLVEGAASWQEWLPAHNFAVSPRLYGFGLVAAADLAAGTQIRGLDPEREAQVTQLHTHLAQGSWLNSNTPQGVILGAGLAEQLHVGVGHELVVLAQAADGSQANALFRVQGILKPVSTELDGQLLLTTTGSFRRFFKLEHGVHELAVRRLSGAQDFSLAARQLNLESSRRGPANSWSTWRELKPVLAKILDILAITANFIFMFIYLTLGGLIINMVFMSVHDRLSEFGTMMALGMTPLSVLLLIIAETAWLALFSGLIAVAVGLPVAFWFAAYGMDLTFLVPVWSIGGFDIEPVLFARVGMAQVVTPLAFMTGALLLFSLYPGWHTTRLSPAKALGHR